MDNSLRPRIKEVIVRSLRLQMPPAEIADDVPLFGEGLGLDSIDALELVLEIERTFGVAIGDEQTAKRVLRSVNSIAEFIEESPGANAGWSSFGNLTASMSTASPRVMTVDVEEWFHICGCGPALAPDRWPLLTSRVVETTTRLLDILDRTGTCATFFVLGYVAERHPELIERIAAGGTRDRLARPHPHARVRAHTRIVFHRSGQERCGAGRLRHFESQQASGRPSGRSTTNHSGRLTYWRKRASSSIRAWRRCASSAIQTIRRRRTGARRGRVRSPSFLQRSYGGWASACR